MKMQRDVSVNGDKERTAKWSQLNRVVPPSFSVPFICDEGVEGPVFFYCYDYRDQGCFRQANVLSSVPLGISQ